MLAGMARPRQADIDSRLIDAWRALSDELPYEQITMTAIAERAGVGKPALYRRYPTKAHLAFAAGVTGSLPDHLPDLGSLEADLLPALVGLVESLEAVPREVYADQIGAAIADADFAHRVQTEYAQPALDQVTRLWTRAAERGEVDPSVDGRAALDLLGGALIFEVMVRHRTPDDARLAAIARQFVHGVTAAAETG